MPLIIGETESTIWAGTLATRLDVVGGLTARRAGQKTPFSRSTVSLRRETIQEINFYSTRSCRRAKAEPNDRWEWRLVADYRRSNIADLDASGLVNDRLLPTQSGHSSS